MHAEFPLNTKLSLDLSPLLLAFQVLSYALCFLGGALLTLFALSLFIRRTALHDASDNLSRIHVLELVARDFAVDVQGLGGRIGVVRQRHELGDAVVHSMRLAVWKGEEEGLGEREGGAKDGGVDILETVNYGGLIPRVKLLTLHCSTQRPRSKMFMMG